MGDQTKGGIAWTDETWNPIRGCRRISAGCQNCYAETMASRFAGPGQPYEGLAKDGRWTGKIALVEKHLCDPLRWRRPRRIFVNSMSDLFFEDLPDAQIDDVFAVMALARRHTFQVLTKRSRRMREYMATDRREAWARAAARLTTTGDIGFDAIREGPRTLPNVWLGVSVENQRVEHRIADLLAVEHVAVRFLSIEPMIGPVTLTRIGDDEIGATYDALRGCMTGDRTNAGGPAIGWVIVGGESGSGARPCDGEWFRRLIGECDFAGVPIFVKQLGAKYIDDLHGVVGRDFVVPSEVHVIGLKAKPAGTIASVRRLKDGHGGDVNEWPPMMDVRRFPVTP
jgi:protein gp37